MQVRELLPGMTLGADPELFILDENDNFVCPDGLVPGSKTFPRKVDHGAVQQDGFAAEYNIDPVDNFKNWKRNHIAVQEQLREILPDGLRLVATPTAQFSQEVWDNASPATKALGCSPDYNAWVCSVNRPPENIPLVRYAGGHAHYGWTQWEDTSNPDYVQACVKLVRQLDWYLGLWSLSHDQDVERRAMYGKAGSMRFKPYGCEYRTLSNFWVDYQNNEDLLLDVWNISCLAIQNLKDGVSLDGQELDFSDSLVECINTSEISPDLLPFLESITSEVEESNDFG